MAETVTIPVKTVGGVKWAELSASAPSHGHQICGETVHPIDQKFSFAGGHRVRLYNFKKNVHWRLPGGVELDISAIPQANPPRRQPPQPKKKHAKG